MDNPKVSVIITTYNHELYLEKCLDSVINQTYNNLEILIIDDGSTDGTIDIISDFKRRHSEIVQVLLNPKNIRPRFTCNQGIEMATGDFVAWNDGDDFWELDKLEKQLKIFQDYFSEVDVVFSRGSNINQNEDRFRSDFATPVGFIDEPFKRLFEGAFFLKISMVVKRSVYERLGFLDERCQLCGDYEYMLRMALNDYRFYGIDEVLVHHRIHSNNETVNRSNAIRSTKAMLIRTCQENMNLIAKHDIDLNKRLAICDMQIAKYELSAGDFSFAGTVYHNLWRQNRWIFTTYKSAIVLGLLSLLPKVFFSRVKNVPFLKKIIIKQ